MNRRQFLLSTRLSRKPGAGLCRITACVPSGMGADCAGRRIKDVRRAGGHETCRLGDGMVNIPAVLATLKSIGYRGWYSWEDEPEDRNPMDLAAWTLNYLQQQLG